MKIQLTVTSGPHLGKQFEFDRRKIMKFMSRRTFKKEMKIAQIEGDESEKRGINWMVISFAIIISILLVGVLALTFLPNNLF